MEILINNRTATNFIQLIGKKVKVENTKENLPQNNFTGTIKDASILTVTIEDKDGEIHVIRFRDTDFNFFIIKNK